jgi:hypothetical protein
MKRREFLAVDAAGGLFTNRRHASAPMKNLSKKWDISAPCRSRLGYGRHSSSPLVASRAMDIHERLTASETNGAKP